MSNKFKLAMICLALGAFAAPAAAQNAPGVTDTEIKIGQTMPYTGPVTAFSTLGKGGAIDARLSGGTLTVSTMLLDLNFALYFGNSTSYFGLNYYSFDGSIKKVIAEPQAQSSADRIRVRRTPKKVA